MADCGHAQNPMQAMNTSAEPIQIALASLPRSIQRPTCSAVNTGMMAKPGSDDTEPEDREAEFERPVGGRDPDDQDQRLGQCHMSEKGDEQPVVDVAFGGDGRARLLGHRRIISRARTRLAGVRLRSLFTGWRAARKGRAVRMPPANAHAEVASRTGGVHGGNSSQISTVCAGPAVNWSRRGRFFSLIVNSTRGRRLGIMRWGGGSLSSFVWLGQCGR